MSTTPSPRKRRRSDTDTAAITSPDEMLSTLRSIIGHVENLHLHGPDTGISPTTMQEAFHHCLKGATILQTGSPTRNLSRAATVPSEVVCVSKAWADPGAAEDVWGAGFRSEPSTPLPTPVRQTSHHAQLGTGFDSSHITSRVLDGTMDIEELACFIEYQTQQPIEQVASTTSQAQARLIDAHLPYPLIDSNIALSPEHSVRWMAKLQLQLFRDLSRLAREGKIDMESVRRVVELVFKPLTRRGLDALKDAIRLSHEDDTQMEIGLEQLDYSIRTQSAPIARTMLRGTRRALIHFKSTGKARQKSISGFKEFKAGWDFRVNLYERWTTELDKCNPEITNIVKQVRQAGPGCQKTSLVRDWLAAMAPSLDPLAAERGTARKKNQERGPLVWLIDKTKALARWTKVLGFVHGLMCDAETISRISSLKPKVLNIALPVIEQVCGALIDLFMEDGEFLQRLLFIENVPLPDLVTDGHFPRTLMEIHIALSELYPKEDPPRPSTDVDMVGGTSQDTGPYQIDLALRGSHDKPSSEAV